MLTRGSEAICAETRNRRLVVGLTEFNVRMNTIFIISLIRIWCKILNFYGLVFLYLVAKKVHVNILLEANVLALGGTVSDPKQYSELEIVKAIYFFLKKYMYHAQGSKFTLNFVIASRIINNWIVHVSSFFVAIWRSLNNNAKSAN